MYTKKALWILGNFWLLTMSHSALAHNTLPKENLPLLAAPKAESLSIFDCLREKIKNPEQKAKAFQAAVAIQRFIKSQALISGDSEDIQKKISQVLNISLMESQLNIDHMSNSAGVAIKSSNLSLNHQVNLGIANISADRFLVHPEESLRSLSRVFGVDAPQLKGERASQVAEAYSEALRNMSPSKVVYACGTPAELAESFEKELEAYNTDLPTQIKTLARVMQSKAGKSESRKNILFFSRLLRNCPRLGLDLSLNEFKLGNATRYYADIRGRSSQEKFPGICLEEIKKTWAEVPQLRIRDDEPEWPPQATPEHSPDTKNP